MWAESSTVSTPVLFSEAPRLKQTQFRRLAQAAIDALGLTSEWGVQYDKHPNDVVLGRECNPDGTVTRVSKLDDENHAWQVMTSPAPIGAINKCAVTRLVSPWVRAEVTEWRQAHP